MVMMGKIQQMHTQRWAYVYLRQSSMGQVRHNQESTKRQYALKDRAVQMGWPQQRIRVLDRDLGISGTDLTNREDFKLLVADVSMNKVGAVFALEASRLSRTCSDWHRLVELCSFTSTLMVDEDGCYEPADFNDRLLLGIKGTISHAELHFIRARLHGGRMNKARRGEYRHGLPVGYRYEDKATVVKDIDEQVRGAVSLLFRVFRQVGSAQGVVRHFVHERLSFPRRRYSGVSTGQLQWSTLSQTRVLEVIKNPCYAGAYVHGRTRYSKCISPEGDVRKRVQRIDMPSWEICIREHHEGYISWEEFLGNQSMLQNNRNNPSNPVSQGAAREGATLLQGLVLCGVCGHHLTVTYKGTGGIYPTYECSWKKRCGVGEARYCLSIRAYLVDEAVCERVLKVMEPAQLEVAVKAIEELQRRDDIVDKQQRMNVERAEYQAQLAQRRYEEVDPSNRLVALTLEQRWNDALVELEQSKRIYEESRTKHSLLATPQQRESVIALAKDFPRLWRSPNTSPQDRKRLVRLLIKDVTVERNRNDNKAVAHIRWQGGTIEDVSINIPPPIWERVRCPEYLVERIREHAKCHTDRRIAEILNDQGLQAAKGGQFTTASVLEVRRKHGIPPLRGEPHEISTRQLAEMLDTTMETVWSWIATGKIAARRIGKQYWITCSEEKRRELLLLLMAGKNKQSYERSAL
jgi:DNA invertase Pin-like site-specific DNA recombinase